MRTVDYSTILRQSAALAGLGKDDVGGAEFALYREAHDLWLQKAWEFYAWPELCPIEQRFFAPHWDETATYAQGDIRFDPPSQAYYQSLLVGNFDNPPTNASGVVDTVNWIACQAQWSVGAQFTVGINYQVGMQVTYAGAAYQCIIAHTAASFIAGNWCLLVPFQRVVPYALTEDDGTELTPIGELLRATDKDPGVTTRLREFRDYDMSPAGYHFVHGCLPVFVWCKYRIRRSELVGDDYDEAATYQAGDGIYFVNSRGVGNFYLCAVDASAGESPENVSDKWTLVPIPAAFRKALVMGGHAGWLEADGQADKATSREGAAEEALEAEVDKFTRQQGQNRKLRFQPN